MSWFLIIAVLAATASLGQGATIWNEDLANEEISESLSIGDYIGTLLATDDQDASKTYVYSIRDISSSPDAFDYLQVDTQSGNVTVKADLDYETFVSMKAQWEADSVRSREVTIYIRNENDNTPVFHGEPYSEEIFENATIGDSVIQVNATDADVNDDVTYTLDNGTGCEMDAFRVDPNSGELFVNQMLDYASIVQYRVCVKATDNGGLFDSTVVVISIRDAQNQPPVFVGQPYDRTIPEDTPVGDVVLRVAANDGDLGVNPRNSIIYRLIENATGTFSVDENNGDIKVEKILDRETDPITQLFTLTVQAIEDDDSQPFEQRHSNTSIYVRLSDVDDNIPTFIQEGPVNATIPEHSPTGTQIDLGLEAFDLDTGEAGQIDLSLEDDDGVFYLASSTIFNSGVVDVRVDNSTALDFERIQEVSFQIRAASIDGLNSSVITAIVELTDINDNTPEFTQTQYDVAIQENADEGTFVIQIEATDADEDAELTYELLGLNNDWFNIDPDTGNITVSAAADFNAELLSVYFLTCLVQDGERVSTSLLNVTITDVNDEEPEFQFDSYIESISEYNMDDLEEDELNILEVVATDADRDLTNRILEYSIESGNVEGKFGINSTTLGTGVIFRQLSIDLETEDATYNLVVMATDNGTPTLSGTTNVIINIEDVNDNDPMFLTDTYNAEVAEDAEFGAVVANVTAVDADVSSLAVLYTIQGATPFLIDQDGIITLSGNLDYEVEMTYNLTVTATDREDTSRMDSCLVLIEILDVNDESPVFETPSPSSIEVNESASFCGSLNGPGDCTVLIILEASDPDTNANLSYSISEVKGYDENNREVSGDFLDQFGVESELGEVYVQKELDRETVQRFDVTVDVEDVNAEENIDPQTDSAELVITVLDVNDNPPEFTDQLPDNFTTPETNQIGMVISVNIRAEDIDTGVNAQVSYELVDDAGGLVQIDPNTGILSVAKPIDREMNDSLSITFCAKDGGIPQLNTTVTRDIFITDVNDNTPQFNDTLIAEASLLENSTVGTFVLRVQATDEDSVFGDLTYSISAGVGLEDFEIDSINGDISVKESLDREEQSLYTLTVVASDGQRQDNLEVTITILDVNDNAPEFTNSFPESTTISETAEPGSSVAVIVATDIDDPDTVNSEVRYSMTNLNGTDFFKIDDETGVVILNTSSTDDLIPGDYVLRVIAFDLGIPRLETEPSDFHVIVTDYNDEAPVFVQPVQEEIVYVEEDYIGYVITAMATDGDLGDNGVVTFSFDTGLDDWKFFSIDEITGEINVTTETDREMQESYILRIVGKNAKSDPIRESQVTFYVEVNDTDDNEPAYWGERTGSVGPLLPPEPTELQVQENLGEGTYVGPVPKAVDLDSDLYNQIYYFLVSGTNEDYFNLEKVSGNLTLLNAIDRELRPDFSLIIRADSNPDYVPDENVIYDPLTDDTLVRVTVTVSDVNDSPPKFEYERYTAGVLFSTAFGVEVITVTAIDPDLDDNAEVEYSITSQTSYRINADGTVDTEEVFVFGINNFGQVVNSITFQKSTDDYYIVGLLATDPNGNFSDTAILSVYLMTETDQVSVIIADEPTNVKETQDEFASLLEEIMEVEGGYSEVSVTIDSTAYELDSNGIGIANRTEMLLHVVDDANNIVIEPSVVQKVIDSASGYTGELVAYHVIEVEYKTKQIEVDVLTTLQTFSFSLAFVMFVILIILLLAFYFSVTSYRRKLRAATITFGGGDTRKEAPLPNTNMYADNKNPVFNLKDPMSDAEESGKEADESPLPREEEDQEAEMSFDVEGVYDEIESGNGQGDNKLLDDLLQNFEKQRGSVNLGYDPGQEEKNLYMSEV